MTVESAANSLKKIAYMFNCSYKKAWNKFMHPAITEKFTFEEVMNHIEDKEA